jgi:hypothetical protein
MPSPLILLLLLLAALPATAAADAEQAYGRARESYRQLLDSPQRQLHRDRWQKVTDGFLAVHASEPRARSPETKHSSSVKLIPGVRMTSAQTARTASRPSTRCPSGAGDVVSKTIPR